MSGLAGILLEMGCKISGSDRTANACTKYLSEKGAGVFIGHNADNIETDVDMVVYSSSIFPDNPELLRAKDKNIPVVHRADILAHLIQSRIGIVVAGAHGKTTTTALIASILYEAGLDPTAVVGGWVNAWDANARLGKGNFLVAESDESDGSFLKLSPVYTVINNIDLEHVDFYHTIERIKEAYRLFIGRTRDCGCVFYCLENPYLREIMRECRLHSISYGLSRECDIYPEAIRLDAGGVEFECVYFGENIGRIKLQIPGVHNVINTEAALALARQLHIDWETIKRALSSYQGTRRRFQIKKAQPVMVVDDYAHHPAEIKVTLEAALSWKKNRIITVFQPHRYSRTFYLKDGFADAFGLADKLVITDIYPGGESPIEGVSGEDIYRAVLDRSNNKEILFLSKDKIIPYLLSIVKDDDLILMLGAGDITCITDELIEKLKEVGCAD